MSADAILAALMGAAALLYASVGHAGASGYLAAMALLGMPAAMMKPTALLLNIVVAAIALAQFAAARQFSWRILWPFAVTSVPCAYLGGMIPATWSGYRPMVGIVLAASAVKLLKDALAPSAAAAPEPQQPRHPSLWVALCWGAVIGLVAGLTGTGGGIFLSPLLVLMRWGRTQQSGGVAAAFILVNSIAGIVGHRPDVHDLSPWMPVWIASVAVGGTVGAYIGSRRARPPAFKALLAAVLVVASVKLIATR